MGDTGSITPGFVENDLHSLTGLPLPQLLDTLGYLPRRVDAQHLLVPLAGIRLTVDVLPASQFSGSGSIDFLVDLGATIIFDPVLDSGDGDDKYERESGGLGRGCAKHGEY